MYLKPTGGTMYTTKQNWINYYTALLNRYEQSRLDLICQDCPSPNNQEQLVRLANLGERIRLIMDKIGRTNGR